MKQKHNILRLLLKYLPRSLFIALETMPPRKVIRRIDKTMSLGPQMQGLTPFKPNLRNIRLTEEPIEKFRKFLERLSTNLGQSKGAILSQVLTNREVTSIKNISFYIHKLMFLST